MNRWIDTAAVLLFAGATGFVALHARGWFHSDERATPAPVAQETYVERVAVALPHLERHVASGSMQARGATCDAAPALADIATLESEIGAGGDPAIAVPLADGIAALRECVACTPEAHGCAAAARAFTEIEERLELPRGVSGI